MRTGGARCLPKNWSMYGLHQLLPYMRLQTLKDHFPIILTDRKRCKANSVQNICIMKIEKALCSVTISRPGNWLIHWKKLRPNRFQTFTFKCWTSWLLASSNWSLSSLVLWRRARAAVREVLTYNKKNIVVKITKGLPLEEKKSIRLDLQCCGLWQWAPPNRQHC